MIHRFARSAVRGLEPLSKFPRARRETAVIQSIRLPEQRRPREFRERLLGLWMGVGIATGVAARPLLDGGTPEAARGCAAAQSLARPGEKAGPSILGSARFVPPPPASIFIKGVYDKLKGHVRLDLAPMTNAVLQGLHDRGHAPPSGMRVLVNGEERIPLPLTSQSWERDFPPGVQQKLEIEYLDARGAVVHRSDPFLLEAAQAPTVNPASLESFEPASTQLPRTWAARWGIDDDLARVVGVIGKRKLVIAPKDFRTVKRPLLGPEDQISVDFDPHLIPQRIVVRNAQTGKAFELPPEQYDVKVDAAFNDNQFLWDDMATAEAVMWDAPEIAASTGRNWRAVQRGNRDAPGAIPREVSKANGVSFNSYQKIHFGESRPSGDYNNPNFMGRMVWKLHSLGSTRDRAGMLADTIASLGAYAKWFEAERGVRDAAGKPVGFWASNLGGGRDNAPRSFGNDHPQTFPFTSWVDMLAQHVGLYKDKARMETALGRFDDARASLGQARRWERVLKENHWSAKEGFFFDRVRAQGGTSGPLVLDERNATAAGFWPLWSGSVPAERVQAIVEKQMTPAKFGGHSPFPSLPRDHPEYHAEGHYWRGGRWLVEQAMAIEGFERSGRLDLAHEYAKAVLKGMTEASNDHLARTGRKTVHEFYGVKQGPDGTERVIPGVEPGHTTREDFTGWSAKFKDLLVRYGVGLRPVAGYLGPPAGAEAWFRALREGEVFAGTNFLADSAGIPSSAQKALVKEGYLEWNLLEDPGDEPLTQRHFEFGGARIEELTIRKRSESDYVVTAKSDRPFNLQVNLLHDGSGKPLAHPKAMSVLQRVGGPTSESRFKTEPSGRGRGRRASDGSRPRTGANGSAPESRVEECREVARGRPCRGRAAKTSRRLGVRHPGPPSHRPADGDIVDQWRATKRAFARELRFA
jgi:hypothetical protein